MRHILRCFLLFWLLPLPVFAQTEDYESFRIELTGTMWLLRTTGEIQSRGTRVDIESDLGYERDFSHFVGKLALKPGRKHRILFEGIPYRLDGSNTLSRQITYAGSTFTVSDRITSEAELNYFFGGYQYDIVSRDRGHFGLLGGAAYFDASSTIRSLTLDRSSSDSITFPLPLAGAEFRGFLLPGSNLLNLHGEVKGMPLGEYGHYVHAAFGLGVGLGRHVTVQVGFAFLDSEIFKRNSTEGVNLRFAGPTFSLQFRDR